MYYINLYKIFLCHSVIASLYVVEPCRFANEKSHRPNMMCFLGWFGTGAVNATALILRLSTDRPNLGRDGCYLFYHKAYIYTFAALSEKKGTYCAKIHKFFCV